MMKPPSADQIRAELERVRTSQAFAESGRLCALLAFVVEETIAGRGPLLKEAVIGNQIYGREPAYDPRIDSAVRVEARRLRRKLEDYFANEGQHDDVRIAMPTGQYAVTFHRQGAGPKKQKPAVAQAAPIFESGPGAAVAIMPFRALSPDPIDQSFADALTDELIFILGRSDGMHVASRGATAHGFNGYGSPADFAAALGVDALIQGTVRRASGLMRVTVEVSNARGFVAWSDRFEAADDQLVELEEMIAATMLNRVRIDNSKMRANQVRPKPEALEAYADIIRARQLLDVQTPESLARALALFERVAHNAPDYARGSSGVADCICDMFRLGLIPHGEAAARARKAALQALEIDPLSVEAHASMGTVVAWIDFDAGAEASFMRSIDLGENARAKRVYGAFLTIRERHDEAETMFREAREMEPFSSQQDIAEATCHYQSRRFDLLLDSRAARDLNLPAEARFYLALADLFQGDGALAGLVIKTWRETTAAFPTLILARAELEARQAEAGRAQRLLAGGVAASHFAVATLALAVNDEARALAELSASIASRELDRAWLRTDIRLDRLRNTAAFDRLMALYAESVTR